MTTEGEMDRRTVSPRMQSLIASVINAKGGESKPKIGNVQTFNLKLSKRASQKNGISRNISTILVNNGEENH